MLISPITIFEVLSQLSIKNADEILLQIHAMHNWTIPAHTNVLPWPDASLYSIWFKKAAPDDGYTKKLEKAINVCLEAESVESLREEAGKLKNAMDGVKQQSADQFKELIEAMRTGTISTENFSELWFQGLANRLKTDSKVRVMAEIVADLSAYHEFDESKLRIATQNKNYNPEKHRNDLFDGEQLIYLADPSLSFLTCDTGFENAVKCSPQAKQIVTVKQEELSDAARVEAILRGMVDGK